MRTSTDGCPIDTHGKFEFKERLYASLTDLIVVSLNF